MNCFHKCRLCLKLCENTMDIFKDDFSKLITILTGLTIEPSDGLPTNSCLDCVKNVKLSVRIRDLIIQSHEILFKEYLVHHRIESSEQSTQEKVKTHNSPDPTGIEQSSLNCHKTEQSETLKQEDSRLFEINATQLEEHEEISNLPENRKEKKYKPSKVLKKVAKFKNEAEVSCVKKTSKIKIPPKKVTCTICRREVRSNWIRKHLETHEYNPSTCEYCGLVSKSATALRHHVFYYHKSAENEYMCDQCGKSFRLKYRLNLHKKKEHGGTQDFECTTCGKRFYERLHLKRHVDKTHQNQRPYVCDGCGKGFKSQNHVKIHKRIHSREAPYSCHMCGERFKVKVTLRTHLKGVHKVQEEQSVFCDVCNRGFVSEVALKAHMNSRVHETEKCQFCSEMFTNKYMISHLKNIHDIG
ncbi:hypothetical protein ABEB36_004323 [Hypothenemus hampei]|uniref:Uncharacterized protein n=1 Tax=Hypothenemus hampei TaxID=57062 RepID=A0ABD1F2Y8_HYPHA